jgi:hypothetical protein
MFHAPRDRQVPEHRGQYLSCAWVRVGTCAIAPVPTRTHAHERVPAWTQEPKGRGSGALIHNQQLPQLHQFDQILGIEASADIGAFE